MTPTHPDYTLLHGDVLAVLRTMPTASVDAIVTDPPAGIGFMNKSWDRDKGGRDAWVTWLAEVFAEARRVIKPGGHALVWALPRTSHWTATAIEDAGWEIRDVLQHIFGSGFPKSLNVSKAIDKHLGAEREVLGIDETWVKRTGMSAGEDTATYTTDTFGSASGPNAGKITAPATPQAGEWDGWGTALKPAVEHWILARAPLAAPSVAANVLAHGTGALNIDASRVPSAGDHKVGPHVVAKDRRVYGQHHSFTPTNADGRWPANLLLSHDEACVPRGTRDLRTAWGQPHEHATDRHGELLPLPKLERRVGYADAGGNESVEDWDCAPGCPVALLNAQSGVTGSSLRVAKRARNKGWCLAGTSDEGVPAIDNYADSGGSSRFFTTFRYQAKPSRKERDYGLEDLPLGEVHRYGAGLGEGHHPEAPAHNYNTHPTVKSVELMRWLIGLITRPGGVVLDLFLGSGTTGIAAIRDGYRFCGIEQEEAYMEIAQRRMARHWSDLQAQRAS